MKLIVGMSGASGAIYGVRALLALKELGITTHLVMTKWARATLQHETTHTADEVESLATQIHPLSDLSSPLSSGSFLCDGMIVAPCSMRSVAAIRTGLSDNLLTRAADVTLKERRKLVLVARESPLSEIHLENLLALSRMGCVILPPMPAFYSRPTSMEQLVDFTVGRILDQFGLEMPGMKRWEGFHVHQA